jgi:hypothetical protein
MQNETRASAMAVCLVSLAIGASGADASNRRPRRPKPVNVYYGVSRDLATKSRGKRPAHLLTHDGFALRHLARWLRPTSGVILHDGAAAEGEVPVDLRLLYGGATHYSLMSATPLDWESSFPSADASALHGARLLAQPQRGIRRLFYFGDTRSVAAQMAQTTNLPVYMFPEQPHRFWSGVDISGRIFHLFYHESGGSWLQSRFSHQHNPAQDLYDPFPSKSDAADAFAERLMELPEVQAYMALGGDGEVDENGIEPRYRNVYRQWQPKTVEIAGRTFDSGQNVLAFAAGSGEERAVNIEVAMQRLFVRKEIARGVVKGSRHYNFLVPSAPVGPVQTIGLWGGQ